MARRIALQAMALILMTGTTLAGAHPGGIAGELVVKRPHAEVRVVRDERDGRRAQRGDLGRQTGERRDEEREKG